MLKTAAGITLIFRPTRIQIVSLICLVALLVGSTLLAPEDVTLGARIRWVYLHVSIIWAGMLLINVAAVMGLYLLLRPLAKRPGLWVIPTQCSGLALFALGFVLSLVAAETSWGGILWMEPRVRASVALLVFGIVIALLVRSTVSTRIIGGLSLALAAGFDFVLDKTGRVFHPTNPIGTSDSTTIRFAFFGLTLVALVIGLVLAAMLKKHWESRSASVA